MPINSGTSIDMATSQGEDAISQINFVIPADAKFTEHLYSKHQEPYMVNAYPEKKDEKIDKIQQILSDPEFKSLIEDDPELLKAKPKDIVSKLENIIQSNSNKILPSGFLLKCSLHEISEIIKITNQSILIKKAEIKKKIKKDQDFIRFAKIILQK